MASASNQPLIHPFKLPFKGKTVRYQAQPPNSASSSREESSGYGISQENQVPIHLNRRRRDIKLKQDRNIMTDLKYTARDSVHSYRFWLKKQGMGNLWHMSACSDEASSLASDGQHDQRCMEEGGGLGLEACPIAVLATYIPVDAYKLMMREHATRPVVRTDTHLTRPATDHDHGMLWYLIRDEGCRPAHALRIVCYAFPDVTMETKKFAASFIQPGYQASDNYLMDISFTTGVRYIDYYSDHALRQPWVSPILKEGIKKPEESSCAYLLTASVCVCSREERALNRIYRHLHSNSLGFEDAEFKKLKRRVLGIKLCECPQV
ncbi:hypothetical protein BKA65DRAFT_576207 [Rhexocercosporidium sp. MPI-PUGE-AT-0058]|nr:hypothetical protein BKA65DRAFT_576207 [Rhexocercosporidium sp. MPI-PUGE-AT-0058]